MEAIVPSLSTVVGEGWPEWRPERGPAESETSNNAGDEDGDIGGPPTDEGVVDDAQEEREDAAFRAKFNYGKGASKGQPTSVESKKQPCLSYGANNDGCKYGAACKYIHDDNAVLEGTREVGKSWDNASRMKDFTMSVIVTSKGGVLNGCRFSHDEISDERLARLRHLHVANQVEYAQDRGMEIPDRNSFKPPAIEEAEVFKSSRRESPANA